MLCIWDSNSTVGPKFHKKNGLEDRNFWSSQTIFFQDQNSPDRPHPSLFLYAVDWHADCYSYYCLRSSLVDMGRDEKLNVRTLASVITFTFVVLSFILHQGTSSDYDISSAVTFYITPDCPTRPENVSDKQYCITLDNFAKHELPNITNATSIALIFLKGVHNLTVPINFLNIQRLTMRDAENTEPLPSIQLLSGSISATSSPGKLVTLEITYLAFNGSGQYNLMVNNLATFGENVNILVSGVNMSDIVFQIANGIGCPVVNISHSSFKASMVEICGCGIITVNQSTFQSGKQPYTIAIFPPQNDILSGKLSAPPSQFSLQVTLDKVMVSDLNDNLPIPSSSLCDDLQLTDHHPTDIYISSSIQWSMSITISNSHFNRSYGTAFQHTRPYTTFNVKDSNFTGYTQGVLVLNGEFDHSIVRLINTCIVNCSINTGGNVAAGLSIIPTNNYPIPDSSIEITGCLFHQNVDNVGNLQIINLHGISNVVISNTSFTNNKGTVIDAKESNVTFLDSVIFKGNSAWQGGALSLISSTMTVGDNTTIDFSSNIATSFGGAIFIDDPLFYLQDDENTQRRCFYQPLHTFTNTTIKFSNNSASKGGGHIYGTSIRNYCQACYQYDHEDCRPNDWSALFDIQFNTSVSPIASKSMRICRCDLHGQPQCADESNILSALNSTVCPGEVFNISVAVVGAEFGVTVGEVYAKLLPLNASSPASLQKTFHLLSHPECTTLSFSINSSNSHEVIYLTTTNITLKDYGDINEITKSIDDFNDHKSVIPYSLLTAPVFMNVTFSDCPLGFTMEGNPSHCNCYFELRQHNVNCTIIDGEGHFSRDKKNWIGMFQSTVTKLKGIIFNTHCPFDHCIQNEVSVIMNPEADNGPDLQCAFNHSGKLCGGCKTGYSVALGSSHCLKCTNNNNLALVVFFAAAGPILYVVISVLDLTIAKGTINGLIFYANIVWVYKSIIFTSSKNDAVIYGFKIFIAWLNLDFGIETCFIKGLDAFWKSMLQYVFPFYIWFIAWLVKVVYNHISVQYFRDHYPQLARITGISKSTDVLTTFFFLSYTKLLRTIVAAFAYATLTNYPPNTTEIVWAVDGNVSYLSGRHIVVLIMGLLSLVVTLSYTIYILLVGLQSCVCTCRNDQSDYSEPGKLDGWLKRLPDMPLPLRDSHFLPLRNEHRYWFGLLLLVRISLLVTYSVTFMSHPRPNLLILMITATLLLLYMGWKNVYNKKSVWILQGLSISNLILLSGGILYVRKSVIVCISIGIAFVQFLGIISHRFIQVCQNRNTQQSSPVTGHINSLQPREEPVDTNGEPVDTNGDREPLLYDNESNESDPPIICCLSSERSMLHCFDCCKK